MCEALVVDVTCTDVGGVEGRGRVGAFPAVEPFPGTESSVAGMLVEVVAATVVVLLLTMTPSASIVNALSVGTSS